MAQIQIVLVMLYFSRLIFKTCCCCPEQGSSCIFIRNYTVLGGGIFQWEKEEVEFFHSCVTLKCFLPSHWHPLSHLPLLQGCSHSWSLWVMVIPRTELSHVWRGHREMSLWHVGEESRGHSHLPAGAGWRTSEWLLFPSVPWDGWKRSPYGGRWCWVAAVVLHFSCCPPVLSFPTCIPHPVQLLDCQIQRDSGSCPSLLGDQQLPLRVLWISKEINQTSWR